LTTNNRNIIRQYKTYRNKYTHLKKISKQNYYKQAFQKCHHDIKKIWKLVNEIIAIKNKSQQNNKLFEDSACQKQCEDLNSFVSEVIYDELRRNLDNNLITCSLFLDLSKAFDCCDHELLLDKLYHNGIRGVSHELSSYFLHNRMQYTKITKGYLVGPAGSVISLLFFLIYINDITKPSSFHTTLFADDINLHMSNSCFNVLQTTVNLELCKIDHWLRANKLSLNYNKLVFCY